MKRWALVENGTVSVVVEQPSAPVTPGEWEDVTGLSVGSGHRKTFAGAWLPPSTGSKISKKAFWNRFPDNNERAMRAILLQGAPVLLAASLRMMEVRVESVDAVDVLYQETIDNINKLASVDVPETVTIDGTTLPLRLTEAEVAAILNTTITDDEAYTGLSAR